MSVNFATTPKFTPVFLSIMESVAKRKAEAQEVGDIETVKHLDSSAGRTDNYFSCR